MHLAQGHTMTLDRVMVSWFLNSGVLIGGAGGQAVKNANIVNSRIESFCGTGADDAIGIDVNIAQGLHIAGTNFEMSGDQDPVSANQLAVRLLNVAGGGIFDCYMAANGVCTNMIYIDSNCHGVKIDGNTFWRVNGDGIGAAGVTALINNEIGLNYSPAPTVRAWDNAFTPVLSFTGGIGTGTYTSSGRYQRNGDMVTCNGEVIMTAKGTAAGNPRISLPVASSNEAGNTAAAAIFAQSMSTVTTIQGLVNQADTAMRLYDPTGAELTAGNFTDASIIFFTVTYVAKL